MASPGAGPKRPPASEGRISTRPGRRRVVWKPKRTERAPPRWSLDEEELAVWVDAAHLGAGTRSAEGARRL